MKSSKTTQFIPAHLNVTTTKRTPHRLHRWNLNKLPAGISPSHLMFHHMSVPNLIWNNTRPLSRAGLSHFTTMPSTEVLRPAVTLYFHSPAYRSSWLLLKSKHNQLFSLSLTLVFPFTSPLHCFIITVICKGHEDTVLCTPNFWLPLNVLMQELSSTTFQLPKVYIKYLT